MERIRFLDTLRGLAVLSMVGYHALFTANYFGIAIFQIDKIAYAPYIIGSMFIIISGIVSVNSNENRQIKKSVELGIIAITISIGTFLFDPNLFIKFGVIHLLSICAFASILIKKIDTWWLVLLSIVMIFLGVIFTNFTVRTEYLFPLGLITTNYLAFDHYPLLPWLGVFSIGVLIGRDFLQILERVDAKYKKTNITLILLLEKIGKKSIQIYILHEPIIVSIILFLKIIK
ncbi:MAG: heparan-alpha-glucosaminide N-acetyltransferase [Candidatus Bilamarchaeum sp.]|jgi:uncharacterized membrane protein